MIVFLRLVGNTFSFNKVLPSFDWEDSSVHYYHDYITTFQPLIKSSCPQAIFVKTQTLPPQRYNLKNNFRLTDPQLMPCTVCHRLKIIRPCRKQCFPRLRCFRFLVWYVSEAYKHRGAPTSGRRAQSPELEVCPHLYFRLLRF